jgi:hypothetical protein
MLGLTTRLLSAVLTFAVGVTLTFLVTSRPRERAPDAGQPPVKAEVVTRPEPARPCAETAAWCVLISFEGRDLGRLDRESYVELRRAIETLTVKREPLGEYFIPRLISRLSNERGQVHYVLVEELPLMSIPGDARLRVHVFDAQGKRLSNSEFTCGWRIEVTGVKRTRVPELDRNILEVGSGPVINGRDVARQYYALAGDAVVLVRLEDSKGRPVKNIFDVPGHAIGPAPAGRTAAEWERALNSDDPAEALSALMWVGGRRPDVKRPLPWAGVEELKEARFANAVRARPSVQELLRRLGDSDNRWVREAAEMAAGAGTED